jgi:aspartyl-tRNA(Asn)/glutamyl-tRNA(Gln) amidotransferase subunit B
MECVSEPDITTPAEARAYLTKMRQMVRWLGIGTGNMDEGALRCDANVSIMPKGSKVFGTKIEIKNMNSISAVHDALGYEIKRQEVELQAGQVLKQQTRGWDEEKRVTVFQRLKEGSSDYRYFPEPDLPPLQLKADYLAQIRASLPELPEARRDRFIKEYDLSLYEAELLTLSRATADWFEECLGTDKTSKRARATANWVLNEVFAHLKEKGAELDEAKIKPHQLAALIDLVEKGAITLKNAKEVFEEMWSTGREAEAIVKEKGLSQLSDENALTAIVDKVIADSPKAVTDFKAGKEASLNFLIGGVMKATRGTANKDVITRLLREKLS